MAMIYFLDTDRLEVRTTFEFLKFKAFIENKIHNWNNYIK